MALIAAPPALSQVAQRFSAVTRGIVAFRLHRVLDVGAGFSHRHEDLSLRAVAVNGNVVRVRIDSYTIDGRPASAGDSARMAQAYQTPQPGQSFHLPFDPRYLAEYRFQAAGPPQSIAFTSVVRDGAHGNGIFTYDNAYDVTSYTYQPNALPPHAASGTIVDRRAQVLPGYWGVTHETQDYKGSYGPFPGRAHEEVDFSGYRRFADLRSAYIAL